MTSLQCCWTICFCSPVSMPSVQPYSPQNQEDQQKGGQRNPPGECGSCGKKNQVRVKCSLTRQDSVCGFGSKEPLEVGLPHKCALSFRMCGLAPGLGALEDDLCGIMETCKGEQHFIREKRAEWRVCLGFPTGQCTANCYLGRPQLATMKKPGLALPFPNEHGCHEDSVIAKERKQTVKTEGQVWRLLFGCSCFMSYSLASVCYENIGRDREEKVNKAT